MIFPDLAWAHAPCPRIVAGLDVDHGAILPQERGGLHECRNQRHITTVKHGDLV